MNANETTTILGTLRAAEAALVGQLDAATAAVEQQVGTAAVDAALARFDAGVGRAAARLGNAMERLERKVRELASAMYTMAEGLAAEFSPAPTQIATTKPIPAPAPMPAPAIPPMPPMPAPMPAPLPIEQDQAEEFQHPEQPREQDDNPEAHAEVREQDLAEYEGDGGKDYLKSADEGDDPQEAEGRGVIADAGLPAEAPAPAPGRGKKGRKGRAA